MAPSWNNRSHTAWRRVTLIAAGAVMALMPIGCAYPELSTPTRPVVNQIPIPTVLLGIGSLAPPNPTGATGKAITYNTALAPVGAVVTGALVAIPLPNGSTLGLLAVSGLNPNRGYAAHAHVNACGADPRAAGPHFQHVISADPKDANPSNEIWLDVRTDAAGAGTSSTTVPFTFTDRAPGSVVIHEAMQTAPGGVAGARIACLTLSGR